MGRHVVLVALVLLSGVVAQALNNTASLNATCSQVNVGAAPCYVRAQCSRCWRTDGCEFDLMSRQCTVASKMSDPLFTVSSLDLMSPNITFCADNDRICSTCSMSESQPICTGTDKCTCRPRCSAMRDYEVACYLRTQSTMVYSSIIVIGVALPLLMFAYKWWARRQGYDVEEIRLEVQRQMQQQARRQRRARARPPSALSLQLDAWRSHRAQNTNDVDKIELANFYHLMENGGQPSPVQQQQDGQRPPQSPSSSLMRSESRDERDDTMPPSQTEQVAVVVDGATNVDTPVAHRAGAQ